MKRIIEIRIDTNLPFKIIKYIHQKNINIYNVIYKKNCIYIWIDERNLKFINNLYDVHIIRRIGFNKLFDYKKSIFKHILLLFFIIGFIFFYTSFIYKIDVISSSTELRNKIFVLLEDKGIVKYRFYKNEEELLKIRNEILNENRDLLEWINIERVGIKYIVNVEPRIKEEINDLPEFCHIVSTKDAIVSRISSSSGVELVEFNDSVKKGDILISGEIKKDDEIKDLVCAQGDVYGHTWYTIDLNITKTYEKINCLNKNRYNLMLNYNNKKKRIFNDRLNDYITKDRKVFDLFGVRLYFQKDIEIEREIVEYSSDDLNKKINESIDSKMKKVIGQDGCIVERKVLKKIENDSTINMSIFIVAEEKIGTIYVPE